VHLAITSPTKSSLPDGSATSAAMTKVEVF
jgi:hypothetical protein